MRYNTVFDVVEVEKYSKGGIEIKSEIGKARNLNLKQSEIYIFLNE